MINKNKSKQQHIKLRNKFAPTEIYYTVPSWPQKDISGTIFVAVNKLPPSDIKQPVYYMRKDSLEVIK